MFQLLSPGFVAGSTEASPKTPSSRFNSSANVATLPCKMKRTSISYTTTPKGTKFHKNRSLLVHIVELSTAVVKVDIKVVNASLTQNQCLQCVTALLTHVEIPRPRDANNDGVG